MKSLLDTDFSSAKYSGFLCDDCVFYRQVPEFVPGELITQGTLALSLRLGVNTSVQNYLTGEMQHMLREFGYKYAYGDKFIKWKYKLHPRYNNYGYLVSLDGSLFKTDWLYDAVKDRQFESPRALEHQLNVDDMLRENAPPWMMAPAEGSCLFVNTVNAVQTGIPAGQFYPYSLEELNDRWLAGQVIALRSFDNIHVQSSHLECPLIFEQN